MIIETILEKQRIFYRSGKTVPTEFRLEQLKKLYNCTKRRENQISESLEADLGKSSFESYMCEIGMVLSEISYLIKHTKSFSQKKRVKTPIAQFSSKSYIQPIPYGNVLIMSPWNYPFLLTIQPLATAISAGNTAIIKPSAYSPNVCKVITEIIYECFSEEYVAVVSGGREENKALLEQKFDFIFFTGSKAVGKEVLKKAAVHLTPVVLELGGKSPCIVDKSADIKLSAKRIVFGKYLNCGQTCIAPDYILCHKDVKAEFIKEVKNQIQAQYGLSPLECETYGKIINEKHYNRLCGLLDDNKIIYGGERDNSTLKISPTIMDNVTADDAVMKEEIFGPIMPILTFESFDEIINVLKTKEKPLALYLFSKDKSQIKRVTTELSYGGGCINDVIIHLATSEMGFGGVGESGMGAYHGKIGFDTFSHQKSIVHKNNFVDLPMRYSPYTKNIHKKLLRMFLK